MSGIPVPSLGSNFRHLKTGGEYMVVGICQLEADQQFAVLYVPIKSPSRVPWARELAEFMDGRFEPLCSEAIEDGKNWANANRQEGHYWVKWGASGNWDVMYWSDRMFWDNSDAGFLPDNFEIGHRLTPPEPE